MNRIKYISQLFLQNTQNDPWATKVVSGESSWQFAQNSYGKTKDFVYADAYEIPHPPSQPHRLKLYNFGYQRFTQCLGS